MDMDLFVDLVAYENTKLNPRTSSFTFLKQNEDFHGKARLQIELTNGRDQTFAEKI